MKANQFETVTKLFAERRLSRRGALRAGAVTAASAVGGAAPMMVAGQDATPVAPVTPATPVTPGDMVIPGGTLFVQSFQSSTVTADPAVTDGYRVTLSGGLGQTIYFSDRPARDVGAMPQSQFLDTFPFPNENPPNAALLTDRGDGTTDLAVVELRNPVVDETAGTVTYDLQGLADWRSGVSSGLIEEAQDLSEVAGTFGSTHLFIDDCPTAGINCHKTEQRQTNFGLAWMTQFFAWTSPRNYCWDWAEALCVPCEPYNGKAPYLGATYDYFTQDCKNAFPEYCAANGGSCRAGDDFNDGAPCSPTGWCHNFNARWV